MTQLIRFDIKTLLKLIFKMLGFTRNLATLNKSYKYFDCLSGNRSLFVFYLKLNFFS